MIFNWRKKETAALSPARFKEKYYNFILLSHISGITSSVFQQRCSLHKPLVLILSIQYNCQLMKLEFIATASIVLPSLSTDQGGYYKFQDILKS